MFWVFSLLCHTKEGENFSVLYGVIASILKLEPGSRSFLSVLPSQSSIITWSILILKYECVQFEITNCFYNHQFVCRKHLIWVVDVRFTHCLHLTIICIDTSRTPTNLTPQISGEAILMFREQFHLQELPPTTIILWLNLFLLRALITYPHLSLQAPRTRTSPHPALLLRPQGKSSMGFVFKFGMGAVEQKQKYSHHKTVILHCNLSCHTKNFMK